MAPAIAVEDNLHGRGMLSVLELPTADDRMYAMRFAIPLGRTRHLRRDRQPGRGENKAPTRSPHCSEDPVPRF